MLEPNKKACDYLRLGEKESHLQKLSKVIGKTLSSYAQAINIQNKRTGALFQKKTKAKCLTDVAQDKSPLFATEYLVQCFSYIHMNPLEANLVEHLEDWPYSSWPYYAGIRRKCLCDKDKWFAMSGMTEDDIRNPYQFLFADELLQV